MIIIQRVFSKYREDIIRNIKDAWPVYFGISDHLLPSFLMSGHAVVCDGYRSLMAIST